MIKIKENSNKCFPLNIDKHDSLFMHYYSN